MSDEALPPWAKQHLRVANEKLAALRSRLTEAEELLQRWYDETGPFDVPGDLVIETARLLRPTSTPPPAPHNFADCIKADGDKPCRDCAEYAIEAVGAPVDPVCAPAPPVPLKDGEPMATLIELLDDEAMFRERMAATYVGAAHDRHVLAAIALRDAAQRLRQEMERARGTLCDGWLERVNGGPFHQDMGGK